MREMGKFSAVTPSENKSAISRGARYPVCGHYRLTTHSRSGSVQTGHQLPNPTLVPRSSRTHWHGWTPLPGEWNKGAHDANP